MLNIEQILIKTAQYFDFDLKKLGIKESSEKSRLYKRQLNKVTIEHIIKNLDKEINSLEMNSSLKNIIEEFIEHYLYISKQLYSSLNKKREKELDWLLLKHFVIPFFAVRISQNFSFYDDRIDKGLPGGDFWYLPTFDKNKSKIIFPINKIIKWLIDLYGGTNEDFYYNKHSNTDNGFSANTLKKWHNKNDIPRIQTIKYFISSEFEYDGVFKNNREVSVELQFKSAIEFIESKSLSIDALKLEVPNLNNMLDKLYTDKLSLEEKGKFVLYIEERWHKPTAKLIEYLMIVSRASHACYKDLCAYFNVGKEATTIDDNCIMQLVLQLSHIYNAVVADLFTQKIDESSELFTSYIIGITKIEENRKEALDEIITSIYDDMKLNTTFFCIDEVMCLASKNTNNRNKAIATLVREYHLKNLAKEQNQQIYNVFDFISNAVSEDEIIEYIESISDCVVLDNIGDYFEGNDYLTNEPPRQNLPLALTIHVVYSRIAQDLFQRKRALHKVLNLLTFPYYERTLGKSNVEEWFFELENLSSEHDNKSELQILVYKAYHAINQKNNNQAIDLIEKYVKSTRQMKAEEYSPQLLFVAQDYMLHIGYTKQYNKLKKINERDPRYNQHIQGIFYFYG